jgi:hypothetical protein
MGLKPHPNKPEEALRQQPQRPICIVCALTRVSSLYGNFFDTFANLL